MSDTRPGMRPPRRYRNDSRSVAKLEVRLERDEEIELPDGSVVDGDRQPLVEVAPKKAPAKKAAAKKAAAAD